MKAIYITVAAAIAVWLYYSFGPGEWRRADRDHREHQKEQDRLLDELQQFYDREGVDD